jgi:uncharacterized protein YceK
MKAAIILALLAPLVLSGCLFVSSHETIRQPEPDKAASAAAQEKTAFAPGPAQPPTGK